MWSLQPCKVGDCCAGRAAAHSKPGDPVASARLQELAGDPAAQTNRLPGETYLQAWLRSKAMFEPTQCWTLLRQQLNCMHNTIYLDGQQAV